MALIHLYNIEFGMDCDSVNMHMASNWKCLRSHHKWHIKMFCGIAISYPSLLVLASMATTQGPKCELVEDVPKDLYCRKCSCRKCSLV